MQQRGPGSEHARQADAVASETAAALAAPAGTGRAWLLALLAIALAAAAAWNLGVPALLPGQAKAPAAAAPPPPPAVSVAKPVVKDVVEWQEFTGRFAAVDQVDVRSRLSGYIEEVHFVDGAVVKKGDRLFTIDQRPARFAISQAEASIKNARSRIEFAEADLARAEQLRVSGTMSQALADQRRRDMAVARADLQGAEAALGRARLDLEYTDIKAPFAGRVSRRVVSPGALVKADETILTTIVALDPIHFYFDVDERTALRELRERAASAAAGKAPPVDVEIALTDQTGPAFKGTLDFVDVRLDEATGTLRTRAVLSNKDHALTPGLFGRVRIPGIATAGAVLLPDAAIASDQDRRIVYQVVEDGTVKPLSVTTGPRIDGYRVIRSGLTGAETVVVNGIMRVRPGAKVAPKPVVLPPVAGETAAPPAAPKG